MYLCDQILFRAGLDSMPHMFDVLNATTHYGVWKKWVDWFGFSDLITVGKEQSDSTANKLREQAAARRIRQLQKRTRGYGRANGKYIAG